MTPLTPQIVASMFPGAVFEHRFCERRWRFDVAWPEKKVAMEFEGGTWSKTRKSRHTTGAGYRNDCYKYNRAAVDGWKVIRATSDMLRDGAVIIDLEAALK